jgi:hypothetical protein
MPDSLHPVYIVYRREMFFTDKILKSLGGGPYLHCEVFVPEYNQVFALFWGHRPQMRSDLSSLYNTQPEFFTYHTIYMDGDEFSRFMQFHISLVEHKNAYNVSDLFFQLVPSRFAETFCTDVPPHETHRKLFCSQAIWLSLREAISRESHNSALKPFLDKYNSRLMTPSHMCQVLTAALNSNEQEMAAWSTKK